jgi:SNF2 family DNA or RNA helicase
MQILHHGVSAIFGSGSQQLSHGRLLPSNTAEGEWSNHCIDCVPLAMQAKEEKQSSAKIRKILEILTDIKDRSEGKEKTIVFSQFTTMLDLIEPFLRDERIRYVRCKSNQVFVTEVLRVG